MNVTYANFIWPFLLALWLAFRAPTLLQSGWSHDDLMNCYRILDAPWLSILRDMLCFWKPTPLYRPLGEAFYKLLWPMYGFEPLPWRLAILVLLVVNALVLGTIAERLTEQRTAFFAASALMVYHPHWTHLYLNTGTVFEMLAFFMLWSGFALWLRFPTKPYLPLVPLWLGLNAKESTLLLLPLIALYDLIWHRRISWRFQLPALALALPFLAGRLFGPQGLASIGDYQPHYSPAVYWHSLTVYGRQWLSGFLGLALLAPLRDRSRLSLLALLWFPLAILPLAFIEIRGLDSVYIACAALPLLAARHLWLCLLLALLQPAQTTAPGWNAESAAIHAFEAQLAQVKPAGQTIVYKTEPFPPEYPWASTFLTRLHFRDTSIPVIGAHSGQVCPGECLTFEWRDGRLYGSK